MASTEQNATGRTKEYMSLFLANQRRLYQFVFMLLRDQHATEDVLQETALLLWEKFEEFTPGTSFFSWASRIAYLKSMEHLKKHRRGEIVLSPEVMSSLARTAVEEESWLGLRMQQLEHCLSKLSENDRELLRKRFEHQAAGLEIARSSGRSVDAIYKAMQRIRRRLLDCIERGMARQQRPGGMA